MTTTGVVELDGCDLRLGVLGEDELRTRRDSRGRAGGRRSARAPGGEERADRARAPVQEAPGRAERGHDECGRTCERLRLREEVQHDTATRQPMKTTCRSLRGARLKTPTTTSTPDEDRGQREATTSAKRTIWVDVDPRTAKNSGFGRGCRRSAGQSRRRTDGEVGTVQRPGEDCVSGSGSRMVEAPRAGRENL